MIMMATDSKMQKFWVFVAKVKEQRRFKIALRPFHYRSAALLVAKEPFLFVCRRSFTSEERAMQEAARLFGTLPWKRVDANLKAPLAFVRRAP